MGTKSKSFALTLTLIVAMSCMTSLTVKPANAQTISGIPQPSVPEFALSFLNFSYNQGVNYILNESIGVSIHNQPFTPYYIDVHIVDLSYKMRWKTQLTGDNWRNEDSIWVVASNCQRGQNHALLNPNATLTNVRIDFFANNCTDNSGLNSSIPDLPVGGQIDFQVQALIGIFSDAKFYGNSSDWSNTQTITMSETGTSTATPNTSTSPTPTVPEFSSIIILILLVTLTFPTLLVYLRKYKRQTNN